MTMADHVAEILRILGPLSVAERIDVLSRVRLAVEPVGIKSPADSTDEKNKCRCLGFNTGTYCKSCGHAAHAARCGAPIDSAPIGAINTTAATHVWPE